MPVLSAYLGHQRIQHWSFIGQFGI